MINYTTSHTTDTSTIIEVQMDAGRWTAIPYAIFDDERLDAASKGILGWLISRPNGWKIRIEYMCRVNNLTEYSWQKKIAKQLVEAGYLVVSKGHADGKIKWIYKVYPASLIPIPRIQGIENAALTYTQLSTTKTAQQIKRAKDMATKRDRAIRELTKDVVELKKIVLTH